MNYYGYLKKDDFESELSQYDLSYDGLNDKEIDSENQITFKIHENEIKYLLVEKGIFEVSTIDNIIDAESNDFESEVSLAFEDFKVDISADKYLSLEVYRSIFLFFKKEVLDIKLNFFNNFRKDVYGLNNEETKKKALSEYKRIYKSLDIEDDQNSFEVGTSDNKTTITPSYFYNLYLHRQKIINRINPHCFLPYLYGDLQLYSEWPYTNTELFEEILSFNISYEILVELNNEFEFELDIYFNNIFYYNLKSIIHDYLFKDTNAFIFTLYFFNNLSEITSTYVESMYAFLISNHLYQGKRTEFMKIVNDEFKIKITKIRDYGINDPHNIRVENIKIDWQNFNKKYC
jgi:hypothetical protein